jgi:putative transposase
MPQSLACLHVHFVFSTKNREGRLTPDVTERLYPYIGGLTHSFGSALIRGGGMPDHVHLLISLGREVTIADAMRTVKANSSGWIHETFPTLPMFAWQAGYGAFAVSASKVGQVKAYIANQVEHHRNRTFQDEYRTLLRKHGIEWDERYVWD